MSEAALYERYVIELKCDVAVNPATGRITPGGVPRVIVCEMERVDVLPDGRLSIRYKPPEQFVTAEQWQALVGADGDFEKVGIILVKDQPAPGVKEWWATKVKEYRRDP